ncbi:MAG TPA: hypothetical protein VFG37_04775 [Planctomycetota bacterium]|jgi:hypothetical protein|nr:hypothetical protein [Planctomycetota bacterium]
MNGNAPQDPSEGPKAASGPVPAVPAVPASAAPPPPPAAGDLDLEVLEIKLPERLKEGFVGQER